MTADTPGATQGSVGSSLGFLWGSMAPRRRRHFYAVIAVMLLGTLAELLTIGAVLPFLALVANADTAGRLPLFRDFAGLVDAQGPDELLFAAAMLLILAAVTAVTVRLWLTRVTLAFVLVLGHEIATKVFARMLRQPYGFYVTRNSSELLASQEKVQAVIWAVLMPGMQAVTAGVIAIAILAMLFLIDPFTATTAAVTLASCYLFVSFVVRRKLQSNSNLLAWAATQRIQTMQEGLGGIRDVLLEQSQEVFETNFIATAKRLIGFRPGMRALDIGTGLGKCMKSLAAAGFDTHGIEPSEPFRTRSIEHMGIDLERVQLTSLEEAELEPASYDFITFGAVLEHLYDPAAALNKTLGWLRPGGVIQAEVPSSNHLIAKLINAYFRLRGTNFVTNVSPMHSPFHIYEFTLDSFRKNGARTGYDVVEHKHMVCSIYHVPRFLHPALRAWMDRTNTGMQLTVWLKAA